MAEAPRVGRVKRAFEATLGADGAVRLHTALVRRAGRWADAASGGRVFVAFAGGDAESEGDVAALMPAGARLFAQRGDGRDRFANAFADAWEQHRGPIAVIGTDQPALGAPHAWGAADDLRDGVDVCFGPATAGGWYLLAAARPPDAVLAIEPGPEAMTAALRIAVESGLSIGWLRSERDLETPADAAALLADPCAPADVVKALRG
jgi:glycosyltransferase A (GT-A) superfamily protein (DUF2064 family)